MSRNQTHDRGVHSQMLCRCATMNSSMYFLTDFRKEKIFNSTVFFLCLLPQNFGLNFIILFYCSPVLMWSISDNGIYDKIT